MGRTYGEMCFVNDFVDVISLSEIHFIIEDIHIEY